MLLLMMLCHIVLDLATVVGSVESGLLTRIHEA